MKAQDQVISGIILGGDRDLKDESKERTFLEVSAEISVIQQRRDARSAEALPGPLQSVILINY